MLVAGEEIELLPERGAYWARARTLLVSDLHWGKCETLRAGGAPVPGRGARGVLASDLARLGRALDRTGAQRLLVLGDLIHAGAGLTDELLDEVAAWRAARGGGGRVAVEVVPGNHDRRIHAVEKAWGLRLHEEIYHEGPFAFTHEPRAMPGKYVWGGHLHPAALLRAPGDSLRLPCFHLGESMGVLPAFSIFTGGRVLERAPGDRVFAIAEDRVIEVPGRGRGVRETG